MNGSIIKQSETATKVRQKMLMQLKNDKHSDIFHLSCFHHRMWVGAFGFSHRIQTIVAGSVVRWFRFYWTNPELFLACSSSLHAHTYQRGQNSPCPVASFWSNQSTREGAGPKSAWVSPLCGPQPVPAALIPPSAPALHLWTDPTGLTFGNSRV